MSKIIRVLFVSVAFLSGVLSLTSHAQKKEGGIDGGGGGRAMEVVSERLWDAYDKLMRALADPLRSQALLDVIVKERPQENWTIDKVRDQYKWTIENLKKINFEDKDLQIVDPKCNSLSYPNQLKDGFAGRDADGSPFLTLYVSLRDNEENILKDLRSRRFLFYAHELTRAAGFSDIEGDTYLISYRILKLSDEVSARVNTATQKNSDWPYWVVDMYRLGRHAYIYQGKGFIESRWTFQDFAARIDAGKTTNQIIDELKPKGAPNLGSRLSFEEERISGWRDWGDRYAAQLDKYLMGLGFALSEHFLNPLSSENRNRPMDELIKLNRDRIVQDAH